MTASDVTVSRKMPRESRFLGANPALGMTSKRLFAFVEEVL